MGSEGPEECSCCHELLLERGDKPRAHWRETPCLVLVQICLFHLHLRGGMTAAGSMGRFGALVVKHWSFTW